MDAKHIRLLNKAKTRLGSAVKRFRQAEEFLDEFIAAIPSEQKQDWSDTPAEYHLLADCRRNIRGARHLTLRLLFQIHRVNFIERKKRYFLPTESDPADTMEDNSDKPTEDAETNE